MRVKRSGTDSLSRVYGYERPDKHGKTPSLRYLKQNRRPDQLINWQPQKKVFRGVYFRTFRRERRVLSDLLKRRIYLLKGQRCNNDSCDTPHTPKKEYRFARYVYYRILPRLYRWLYYEPDRVAVDAIEDKYYHTIVGYNCLSTAPFVSKRLKERFMYQERGSPIGSSSNELQD